MEATAIKEQGKQLKKLGLKIPADLKEQMFNYCEKYGYSKTDFIRLSVGNVLGELSEGTLSHEEVETFDYKKYGKSKTVCYKISEDFYKRYDTFCSLYNVMKVRLVSYSIAEWLNLSGDLKVKGGF